MFNATKDDLRTGTIAIYLGGLGCKAGEQLYRQLQAQPVHDRGHVEVMLIDSDKPTGHPEMYARQHHYFYRDLNEVRTAGFQKFSDERFPRNLGRNPLTDTSNGCGITRAFAMASLARNRKDFEEMLSTAYGRIQAHLSESSAHNIRVFFTASACGGTGAGMVVDAMAMTRDWFMSKGDEAPLTSLFLVAPDVLTNDPAVKLDEQRRRRMTASSYALMKELNGFAEGKPFETHYHSTDARISLDTSQPNQWLFDWVYLFNRKNLDSKRTYTQDELVWKLAELQTHMTRGAIARRLNAIAPNIREQREQRYPIEYQADLHESRTEGQIASMERNSRGSFLASLAVVSVRFPVDELKEVFHLHWSLAVLRNLIHGNEIFLPPDEEDHSSSGLLMRNRSGKDDPTLVRISREEIAQQVAKFVLQISEKEALLERKITEKYELESDAIGDDDEIELDERAQMLAEQVSQMNMLVHEVIKFEKAGLPSFCEEFLTELNTKLGHVLAPTGDLCKELLYLATGPNASWGIEPLRDAVSRLIDDKQRELGNHRATASIEDATQLVRRADKKLNSLIRTIQETPPPGIFDRAKRIYNSIVSDDDEATGFDELKEQVELTEKHVNRARRAIAGGVAPYIHDHACARIYELEIDALNGFAERLDRKLQRLQFCVEKLEGELSTRLHRIHQMTGEDKFGAWTAPTIVNIGGDLNTIRELQRGRFNPEQKVAEAVLSHLHADGLSTSFGTLHVHDLHNFQSPAILEAISSALAADTILKDQLAVLDRGWLLPEMDGALRSTVPFILDDRSAPLLRVSPAALQPKLDSWIVAPNELDLPDPFLKKMSVATPFRSKENSIITVVRAMYGIPPSACHDVADWFNDYLDQIGDLTKDDEEMGEGRFPLHIFNDGATRFNEIYQPISLIDVVPAFDYQLVDFAVDLGIITCPDGVYMAHEFPFTLRKEIREKLEENEVLADQDVAAQQDGLTDDEWTEMARFRLSVCEKIRRRASAYSDAREEVLEKLKQPGREDLAPLIQFLSTIQSSQAPLILGVEGANGEASPVPFRQKNDNSGAVDDARETDR